LETFKDYLEPPSIEPWNEQYYLMQFVRAAYTILEPFGADENKLQNRFDKGRVGLTREFALTA
jgi:hypothetical protein